MPRISYLAIFASTLALLLPACDPPDDGDTAVSGPGDFSDAPDEPEDDTDPRPRPHRLDRFSAAPRGHEPLPGDADRPDDLHDAPYDQDTCAESHDQPDDLVDD